MSGRKRRVAGAPYPAAKRQHTGPPTFFPPLPRSLEEAARLAAEFRRALESHFTAPAPAWVAAAAAAGAGAGRDSPPPLERAVDDFKPSTEQAAVINAIHSGRNVFFTGSAGTGKSALLNYLLESTFRREKGTHITASTGIAAVNIGGTTLHKWAGIGLAEHHPNYYIKIIRSSPLLLDQWQSTKRLVLDEVSMISAGLVDKLAVIAKAVRNDPSPFGGIQLVFSGDFMQLPPVSDAASSAAQNAFAFCADMWSECFQARNMFALTQVFRQDSADFVTVLNEVRFGRLSAASYALLQAREGKALPAIHGIIPTNLYARRRDVAQENDAKLKQLPGSVVCYNAHDAGSHRALALLAQCQAPPQLMLKVGAQVILLKNLAVKSGLSNGSRGVVEGFVKEAGEAELVPLVRFVNGIVRTLKRERFTVGSSRDPAERGQYPLALAWALTIHKSQGQTLDLAKVCLDGVFERGQTYVALSRMRSPEGLSLSGLHPSKVIVSDVAVAWYREYFPASIPAMPDVPATAAVPVAAAAAAASSAPSRAAVGQFGAPAAAAAAAAAPPARPRVAAAAAAAAASSKTEYADDDLDAAIAGLSSLP